MGQPVDFGSDQAREIMRLAKAAEIANYMNTTVDPCHDFYRFACGNWAKINPAYREAKTGIFNVLSKAYDRKVWQLLNAAKHTDESNMERKVKYFYESCLDIDGIKKNYHEQLLSVIEEFGGMPALKGDQWDEQHFDWLKTIALILRRYGKQIIIAVDISADLSNNEINRLYIGQMDDLVTSKAIDYYTALKLSWQNDLHQVLGISQILASHTAAEMADFRRQLATGMSNADEGLGMEDKTKLRLLEEMNESYKPTIDFMRFVRTWLGYEYKLPVYEYVENYQRNLRTLIMDTPKHVVANYIMWELLQNFRIEVEATVAKQKRKCVDVTKKHFIKYLDNMVYRHITDSQTAMVVSDVTELWSQLKHSFEVTLQSNSTNWMSNATRYKALEKLSAMTMSINSYEHEDFEKEFGDLVISTENYFENVINILELAGRNYRHRVQEPPKLEEGATLSFTPAYAPELNRVLVPVAFLQPRYLWDDVYPNALRYGTVGYIIAHELSHGFDDTIRKYDARGNLNNWWDKNSTAAFVARKECLRRQYGEFSYNGHRLRKINAQGENIADNVGIRIAYQAYQHWLQRNAMNTLVQQEQLPYLNYTERKLFFISAAQVWCTDINQNWRQILATTDIHAPEELRVIGMMSNFDEFSREFECPTDMRMNPPNKCVVY